MIEIARHRSLSWNVARSDVRQAAQGDISHGWQDKSPDIRRGHVVGWIECFGHEANGAFWRSKHNVQWIQCSRRRRQHFRGRRAP